MLAGGGVCVLHPVGKVLEKNVDAHSLILNYNKDLSAVYTGALEHDEGTAALTIIYTLSYHQNGISR